MRLKFNLRSCQYVFSWILALVSAAQRVQPRCSALHCWLMSGGTRLVLPEYTNIWKFQFLHVLHYSTWINKNWQNHSLFPEKSREKCHFKILRPLIRSLLYVFYCKRDIFHVCFLFCFLFTHVYTNISEWPPGHWLFI